MYYRHIYIHKTFLNVVSDVQLISRGLRPWEYRIRVGVYPELRRCILHLCWYCSSLQWSVKTLMPKMHCFPASITETTNTYRSFTGRPADLFLSCCLLYDDVLCYLLLCIVCLFFYVGLCMLFLYVDCIVILLYFFFFKVALFKLARDNILK